MASQEFQWLIAALAPKPPLAAIAREVGQLADAHGSMAVQLAVGRPKGWVSKMCTVDRAVRSRSIAGVLVSRGAVQDLETAYYMSKIERESPNSASKIAANIKYETRQSAKRAWEALR